MIIVRLLISALFFTVVAAGSVRAAVEAPYSQAAFAAAQQQNKPILLHITAPWCPVCAKQKPILSRMEAEPAFKDLQVFDIDFDTQKDLLKSLNVQKQSTFIAYHGGAERARSTGETDEAAIRALVAKSSS